MCGTKGAHDSGWVGKWKYFNQSINLTNWLKILAVSTWQINILEDSERGGDRASPSSRQYL